MKQKEEHEAADKWWKKRWIWREGETYIYLTVNDSVRETKSISYEVRGAEEETQTQNYGREQNQTVKKEGRQK